MSLSANTLFHFTSNLETLSYIVKGKFRPSYCLEYYPGEEKNLPYCSRAYPMVCFCDIRLAQIKDHINQYGKFGIGLKKSWGISHGVTPISYIHNNSPIYKNINNLISLLRTDPDYLKRETGLTESLISLKKFLKPYEGTFWNKECLKFSSHDKSFYDEREWRYILTLENGFIKTMSYEEFLTYKPEINERLHFDIDDVKYVLLENEICLKQFKDKLIDLDMSSSDIDRYISKVITIQNLMEDF